MSQQIPSEPRVILSVVASHHGLGCYQGVLIAARAPGGLVEEAEEDALGGEGVCVCVKESEFISSFWYFLCTSVIKEDLVKEQNNTKFSEVQRKPAAAQEVMVGKLSPTHPSPAVFSWGRAGGGCTDVTDITGTGV